ncbi:hypothetical protein ANME2D_03036 [Candidatus Methanoperedens nitroreducens]|uniref:DUF86 domain-containing protein n=2 Tax=Candidatus Methanoperedens nitratireducens TaxID=1392998 RepID=A0A062V0W1_9EURY|nr:hypothetical protein ANME2D_03036 [Candidatus Methanoperedens nitroreducens]
MIDLDNERLIEKMDELENYLRELEEYLPEDEDDYLKSGMRKRACERAFQLACENLLDICNLIISEEGFGIPADSKDTVKKLAEHGVISKYLGSRLEELVGFRNLLVHLYGKVDDSRAYNYLHADSKDFYEFLEAVENYITSKSKSKK